MAKALFYNRTTLQYLKIPVPVAFQKLDEVIDRKYSSPKEAFCSLACKNGENICKRYSDIKLYGYLIAKAVADCDALRGACFCASHMVSYLSAVKSLLDAVAICRNETRGLALEPWEQDLTRGAFWVALRKHAPKVANRFEQLRCWYQEVKEWRNSAVHRLTPFSLLHAPGPPGKVSRKQQEVRIPTQPKVGLQHVICSPEEVSWMRPADLIGSWQDSVEELVNLACEELVAALG